MGPQRLFRPDRARFLRESPRFLRSRPVVAAGKHAGNLRRVKVHLYFAGKPKDPHANALAAEYIRRAHHYAPCIMTEYRPDHADFWSHPGAKKILLDPAGKSLDSTRFADIFTQGEMRGHDLSFVVGPRRLARGMAGLRRSAAFPLRLHHAPRTRPRRARRTDLPRVYNIARQSLPALMSAYSMSWFKRDPDSPTAPDAAEKIMRTEGLWLKCEGCREIIWKKDLELTINVCGKCGYHFRLDARPPRHAFRRWQI